MNANVMIHTNITNHNIPALIIVIENRNKAAIIVRDSEAITQLLFKNLPIPFIYIKDTKNIIIKKAMPR